MQGALSDQHKVDKVAKDERWPNMYGDLDPLPEVKKDMVAGADPRPLKWRNENEIDQWIKICDE